MMLGQPVKGVNPWRSYANHSIEACHISKRNLGMFISEFTWLTWQTRVITLIQWRCPNPWDVMQPQTMILPPPCFTWVSMFCFSKASPSILQQYCTQETLGIWGQLHCKPDQNAVFVELIVFHNHPFYTLDGSNLHSWSICNCHVQLKVRFEMYWQCHGKMHHDSLTWTLYGHI